MKEILIALLLIVSSSAYSQINYVLNPDLETHTYCPTNNDQISAATFWSGVDSSNGGLLSCVPDYCHTCVVGSGKLNGVPDNPLFWQYPHSGNGMAQVGMYFDESNPTYVNKRDYLQGRLSKKLLAGKSYCVSFYVCLEEISRYAVKEIGAYFDNGSIDTTHTCGEPQVKYTPQVVCSTTITDTMNWTRIEGSFTAVGTEQFITIGNFKDKAHSTLTIIPLNNHNGGAPNWSAYLIDDVSVIESDLKADAGPDKHVGLGDSIYIGRPKEVGLECTWTVQGSSTVIGTGAGIWVKPTVATNYIVTQTLCGNITKDTVRVEVWKLGVNSINGKTQSYSLSPNPTDGNIQLLQGIDDAQPVRVDVFNTVGIRVYSATEVFTNNKRTLNLGSIPSGMYYMALHDGSGTAYTLRFVKK